MNHLLSKKIFSKGVLAVAILCYGFAISAQEANYDRSKLPVCTIPDPLVTKDGKSVRSPKEWKEKRRPEIYALFESQMYGKAPGKPKDLHFKVLSEDKNALDGTATRKEVAVYFTKDNTHYMTILMYLPNGVKTPVPLFVGLNFNGNYMIDKDPDITMTSGWVPNGDKITNNQANPALRGSESSEWPVDMILKRGYGIATIYSGDIEPDYDHGFQKGVHPLFYDKGQTHPRADQWGTIAAWAWGLSRAMDYFEKDKAIDKKHVAVIGHSRMGKTALWAGASDERFALVISNNSGCGGAALSRRKIGETVAKINGYFPYWFCENFKQYNNNESALPLDQHELIALIAPRPVYIASAQEDNWADQENEFRSGLLASPVYALFGLTGLPVNEMPQVNRPVQNGFIAYHIRTGKHDITPYDWEQYLNFADKHFKKQ
jgi:hypothetical protein